VAFSSTGTHSASDVACSSAFGEADYCYSGSDSGTDIIAARLYGQVATVTNEWVEHSDNQPPAIQMEPYQTAQVNQPFHPAVTVSDDGLPTDRLTVFWRMLSGPALPAVSDPHALDTAMVFDVPGCSYQLELVVSDSEFCSRSVLDVYVDGPPTLHEWHMDWQNGHMRFYGTYSEAESSAVTIDLFEGDTLLSSTYGSYSYWGRENSS
jgi:hypothetical protein